MTTSSSSSPSPILPLDLRLRTLEAQLFGVPSSLVDDCSSSASSSRRIGTIGTAIGTDEIERDAQRKGVTHRMREIEDSFDRLAGQSDGLKRLLEGYEQYQSLIALPTNQPSSSTSTDGPSDKGTVAASIEQTQDEKRGTQQDSMISESDLLSDRVKLSMILEAAGDIRNAERDLREIELLRTKRVEGSGSLEELLPYRPTLIKAIKETLTRSAELDRARRDVGQLLMRYNGFTSTTSELFVDVHYQLEYLEERVRALERKKKKELAERY
ncbi:hypothetical protein IAT40_002083 [Kwoniella sp. CBS 6097]